ncbi:MAG: peptidase M23 [Flavobacteriales bacterium]|nr:peptidase M23 [Flavobacteriales bacterium]|tara:strand:- start:1826 stop:3220 length:1395 start_codon:yes stop_codon:yes gene_type:complete
MKKIYNYILLLLIIFIGINFYFDISSSLNKQHIKNNDTLEKEQDVKKTKLLSVDDVLNSGGVKNIANSENTNTFNPIPLKLSDSAKSGYAFYSLNGIIKENESLDFIFKKYNVSDNQIYKLVNICKDQFDFTSVGAGREYSVIYLDTIKNSQEFSKTKLISFIYNINKIDYIIFNFKDTISYRIGKKKVLIKENFIAGSINKGEGLWIALSKKLGDKKTGLLVEILANDIFPWTIDFYRVQENDSFSIYFEERYVEKEYVDIGQVFAASFTHNKNTINAFQFEENTDIVDYFDDKGNNLRRNFLKAPLKFKRISSRYGMRKHPVSGKFKKHTGIDYAAPTGTKVMATAKGEVVKAVISNRGYGNYVEIKHNEKYKTLYAHLHKIKKGIKKGSVVHQGQTIGYVGSTGRSTGPHLHYEFKVNNKHVDPYKQKLPAADPLKPEKMEEFSSIKDDYLSKINDYLKNK